MVFSSLNFLFIFLPITLLVYFLMPFKGKNIVLLIASIIFYAWGEPVYVLLMILNIGFNYIIGLQFAENTDQRIRKIHLIIAIAVNLLLLGSFKYAGFILGTFGLEVKGASLPIGISFYTFQALSYVIDAYKGKVRVQKNIINFATYITMFPQLIAGPIVTYATVEEQLENRTVSFAKAGAGVERLILGLSKKVILANNLGLLFSMIQNDPHRSVLSAWLGLVAYAFQMYFDFSGYSDMAIGMGKMLGFTFPENFDFPYLADNITELWRRWHMTLTGWFREYVYIPLGGNRKGKARHILNIFIVWMLTGLWHGAAWNFVLWGFYFGVIIILEKYVLYRVFEKMPRIARHAYAMIIMLISWVLFANTSFGAIGTYFGTMFGPGSCGFVDSAFFYYLKSYFILFVIAFISGGPFIREKIFNLSKKRPAAAVVIELLLFLVCIAFLVYGSYNPFLYFRF